MLMIRNVILEMNIDFENFTVIPEPSFFFFFLNKKKRITSMSVALKELSPVIVNLVNEGTNSLKITRERSQV